MTTTSTFTATATSSMTTTFLTRESRDAVLQAEALDMIQHCLVCYSELTYTTKTPCDHNEICGVCHLRLRYLHQDFKCPICKTRNEKVIVDKHKHTTTMNHEDSEDRLVFDDYPIWGNSLGSDFVFREDVGMFIEQEYFEREIQPLFGYYCGVKDCDYDGVSPEVNIYSIDGNSDDTDNNKTPKKPTLTTPIRALQDHLRTQHRLALCSLCVDHQRDFVSRLPRMTPTQLRNHLTTGGNVAGEEGHPVCEFCKPTRFYDLTQLYQHLAIDHYKCHVCQQTLGMDNQYFKDYHQLERHFDRQHYLCHDVQCMTSRFVVFGSELDLRHHERTVHGGTSTGDSKIQLEFRVRRGTVETSRDVPGDSEFNYDLDGQAFVPAALPTPALRGQGGGGQRGGVGGGNEHALSLHPLHVQRTAALRQQAAALREAQESTSSESAYPTLTESTFLTAGGEGDEAQQQQHRLRMGWTDGSTIQRVAKRNAGEVSEQDFPSLATTTTATHTTRAAAASGSIPSRQFAAMTAAASNNSSSRPAVNPTSAPPPTWGSGSAAAVVAAPAAAPELFLLSTSSSTALTPLSRSTATKNTAANLTAENFPSLGPAPSTSRLRNQPYTAAHALTKNKKTIAATTAIPNNFSSSLSAATVAARQHPQHVYPAVDSLAQKQKQPTQPPPLPQKPPSMDSVTDFPAPPSTTSHPKKKPPPSSKLQASASASSSLPQIPSAVAVEAAKATVGDVKAVLGTAKYKQLKSYTKDFMVTKSLEPEAFVDLAAALFERGYADVHFWSFVPELLDSCPDKVAAHRATIYMNQLRKMEYNTPNGGGGSHHYNDITAESSVSTATTAAVVVASGTTSSSSTTTTSMTATGTAPKGQWSAGYSARVVAAPPPAPPRVVPPSQKTATNTSAVVGGGGISGGSKPIKNAWGSGGSGTTTTTTAALTFPLRAKPPSAPAPMGSATKFMAQAKKQETKLLQLQKLQDVGSTNKKKNNKQKDQLRQLAFGP